jgi:hypothetical protein
MRCGCPRYAENTLDVRLADFRWLRGRDQIAIFSLPKLYFLRDIFGV